MSDAQLSANRANAQFSTGPVTVEGKARSSLNAIRHGFYSAQPVLPGESQEEFDAMTREMFDDLQPAGAMQQAIVERLVATRWKQLRMQSLQAEYVRWRIEKQQEPFARGGKPTTGAAVIAFEFLNEKEGMKNLMDLEIKLDRLFLSLMRELQRLKKQASQESCDENGRNEARSDEPANPSLAVSRNEAKSSESAPSSFADSRNEAKSAVSDKVAVRATSPMPPVVAPNSRDQQRKAVGVIPGTAKSPLPAPRRM